MSYAPFAIGQSSPFFGPITEPPDESYVLGFADAVGLAAKQLDWIPLPEGFSGSWNDLTDKPVITPFAETLLDDADQLTARTTLGLGEGDEPKFYRIDTAFVRNTVGTLSIGSYDYQLGIYADHLRVIDATNGPSLPYIETDSSKLAITFAKHLDPSQASNNASTFDLGYNEARWGTLWAKTVNLAENLEVYNSYTNSTNNQGIRITGAGTISTFANGTGTRPTLTLNHGAVSLDIINSIGRNWRFTAGNLQPLVDGVSNLGAATARIRTVYTNTINSQTFEAYESYTNASNNQGIRLTGAGVLETFANGTGTRPTLTLTDDLAWSGGSYGRLKGGAGYISISRNDTPTRNNVVLGYSSRSGIGLTSIGGLFWANSSTDGNVISGGLLRGGLSCPAANEYHFGNGTSLGKVAVKDITAYRDGATDTTEVILVDWQQSQSGGAKKFYVQNGGTGTASTMYIGINDAVGYGVRLMANVAGANQVVGLGSSNKTLFNVSDGVVGLQTEMRIGGSARTYVGFDGNVHLVASTANILEMRKGTDAQRLNIYNRYDSSANNEGFAIDWQTTPDECRVGTFANGTGSKRAVGLYAGDSYPVLRLMPTTGYLHLNNSNSFFHSSSLGNDVRWSGHLQVGYGIWVRSTLASRATGMDAIDGNVNLAFYGGGVVGLQVRSTGRIRLGVAAVAETPAATHTLIIEDSTGTQYKVLASVA